jgi:hypothetical protein
LDYLVNRRDGPTELGVWLGSERAYLLDAQLHSLDVIDNGKLILGNESKAEHTLIERA